MSVVLPEPAPSVSMIRRLFLPVCPASLAVFRVSFGVLMVWEVTRYFSRDWIQRYYVTPRFHFTYYGVEWIAPWPGDGMPFHFYALGLLAALIALGFLYRLAAALFFVAFTYVFLLEQARYLNHFYLISLISLLLACVPAHAMWSLDSLRWRSRDRTVPAWSLWLLRFQVAIPYVYGGIAKLNSDWLRGEPLRSWLAGRSDLAIIGPWLTSEWVIWLFVYGGLLLDLCVVPLVVWRRTRLLGLGLAASFHLLNSQLFTIGVFPPMMMAATLLFLPADWPLRVRGQLKRHSAAARQDPALVASPLTPGQRAGACLLGLYAAAQLLVPFRHLLYPGNVAWTEEGHRFSWRMKLRDKEAEARFIATDPSTGQSWSIEVSRYLTGWQYDEMASRPDMILQFAHFAGKELSRQAGQPIEIRVDATASLNGRRDQRLIDPTIDLTTIRRSLRPADWIVPLHEPLPPR